MFVSSLKHKIWLVSSCFPPIFLLITKHSDCLLYLPFSISFSNLLKQFTWPLSQHGFDTNSVLVLCFLMPDARSIFCLLIFFFVVIVFIILLSFLYFSQNRYLLSNSSLFWVFVSTDSTWFLISNNSSSHFLNIATLLPVLLIIFYRKTFRLMLQTFWFPFF